MTECLLTLMWTHQEEDPSNNYFDNTKWSWKFSWSIVLIQGLPKRFMTVGLGGVGPFLLSFCSKNVQPWEWLRSEECVMSMTVLKIKRNKTTTVLSPMQSYPTYRCGTVSKRSTTGYKSLQRNSMANCARVHDAFELSKGPPGSHTTAVMSRFFVYILGQTWDQKCKHTSIKMISVKPNRKWCSFISFSLRIHICISQIYLKFHSNLFCTCTRYRSAPQKFDPKCTQASANAYLHTMLK